MPEPAPPASPGPSPTQGALPFLAVAGAALAAYANALRAPFVLDDVSSIVLASRVHALSLSPSALAPAVAGFPADRWLVQLTFAVNHALGGLEPAGYRAVNLVFHAAAAILVLLLAREILARVGGLAPAAQGRAALVAALLFALHPLQTQAVTYVVQRMTSMGGFFALLALLLWVRGRAATGARRALRLGGAALSAYLAFACKENHAVLPLLALLLDALLFPGLGARLRRHPRGAIAVLAGLAGLAALLAARYAWFLAAEAPRYGATMGERLLTQPRVLWHYLSLLVLPLPSRLHLDYYWPVSRGLLDPPSTLLALAGLLALVALALAAAVRRRAPLVAFAMTWFLCALLVEQTIVPLHFVFEHRMYLPSVGWFVAAAWGLERALASTRVAPWLVAGPLLAALAAGTVARNAVWNDPMKLYADPASHGPGSAGNLITLGKLLRKEGKLDEAETALRRAIALEPDHPAPLVNLAAVLGDRGRTDEAVALSRRAIAMNPGLPEAWYGLSFMLLRAGRIEEAEETARRGLAANPGFAPLRIPISACRERRGDLPGARHELEEALRADPGVWPAWYALAQILLLEGRAADALPAARRYAENVPGDPQGHAVLGRVLLALGRTAEARAAYENALRIDPAQREARRALAALGAR